MLQEQAPIFSDNAEGYVKLVVSLSGAVLGLWGILRARLKQEFDIRADINGVGERVKKLEEGQAATKATESAHDIAIRDIRSTGEGIVKRLAGVEQGHVAILDKLDEIRQGQTEEYQRVRERLVSIETVESLRREGRLLGKGGEGVVRHD